MSPENTSTHKFMEVLILGVIPSTYGFCSFKLFLIGCMGLLILGAILWYMVSASLSCSYGVYSIYLPVVKLSHAQPHTKPHSMK